MSNHQTKLLLKILIGVAWIDGVIQPEERQKLNEVAIAQDLAQDEEIKPLLHGLVVVKPEQCYEWLTEYLGQNYQDRTNTYQELMEAIGGLIYSDGFIANEEAKLLSKLEQLNPENNQIHSLEDLLNQVRSFYQSWVKKHS
jgi:geranylgeranyl pyrophosphate synthase